MSDPTMCQIHTFPYRICLSCKCVHCVLCQPETRRNYSVCYRCGKSTQSASYLEIERYGIEPPGRYWLQNLFVRRDRWMMRIILGLIGVIGWVLMVTALVCFVAAYISYGQSRDLSEKFGSKKSSRFDSSVQNFGGMAEIGNQMALETQGSVLQEAAIGLYLGMAGGALLFISAKGQRGEDG